MNSENLLFTVVYPQALYFFRDFCFSATSQFYKDFDVLVINDGCKKEDLSKFLAGLNYTIVEAVGTPADNRIQGIKYGQRNGYRYLIFCDADDTFVPERVGDTINKLNYNDYDILVCNLNIVDENLNPLICDYFSSEIPEDRPIDKVFVQEKNIFGMSNTAIKLNAIKEDIVLPETPIVDWYLFTLLLNKGLKAYYVSQSYVNYRQYSDNLIGINCYDTPTFRRLLKFKYNHYSLLVKNGYEEYIELLSKCGELMIASDTEISTIISKQLKNHKQPLWWQVINNH